MTLKYLTFADLLKFFRLQAGGMVRLLFMFIPSREKTLICARNKLSINPHYTLENCPQPDILVVPGGFGTRKEMLNKTLLEWINQLYPKTEHILSVCTGALILAKAGLVRKHRCNKLTIRHLMNSAP